MEVGLLLKLSKLRDTARRICIKERAEVEKFL
jgi:hypothetical protein